VRGGRSSGVCLAVPAVLVSAARTKMDPTPAIPAPEKLTARVIRSGFADAHDTYNAISCASDGRIYYVLSSEKAEVAAQMYVYDPRSDSVKHAGDLTEACGEKGQNAIAQGKSHVSFAEADGKLYFATHIGYYSIIDGMESRASRRRE
jgi:hypothetical protein